MAVDGKFRCARVVIFAPRSVLKHKKKIVAQFSVDLIKFRLEIFFNFLLLFLFACVLFWF